jgi:hypothetical protein
MGDNDSRNSEGFETLKSALDFLLAEFRQVQIELN